MTTTAELTERQTEVLRVYAETGSYQAVAYRLGISRSTVRQTLANVRERLDVATTVQAVHRVFGG